ncbi:MAG TPA: hypothetical protein VNT99_16715 [Methylomirabilota bacterium]|nr:hypothetical protein [Methylomirabilota bacterium]
MARPPLDARFASRPHTAARLHAIADLMDEAIARGATADEAEEIALVQLRALGADLLTDWARTRHDESVTAARAQHPDASQDSKKN